MSPKTLKPFPLAGGRPRKHGAYNFIRHGVIPPGKEYLADMADAAIGRMAQDLGGLDHLSGGQVVILREIRQLMIFKFLVDEKLMSEGLFKSGPGPLELQGCMNAFYLSCCNSITRYCAMLGLKKIAAADDLQTYLAAKARTADREQAQPGQGEGQGAPGSSPSGPAAHADGGIE